MLEDCPPPSHLFLFPCVIFFSGQSVQTIKSWLWSILVSELGGRTALASGKPWKCPLRLLFALCTCHWAEQKVLTVFYSAESVRLYLFSSPTLPGKWFSGWWFGWWLFRGYGEVWATTKPPCCVVSTYPNIFPQLEIELTPSGEKNNFLYAIILKLKDLLWGLSLQMCHHLSTHRGTLVHIF